MSGEALWGLLGFVALVCVRYISVIVVQGACVRDCKWLELCKVGIVSWSAGDECVGGWCSLVTSWRRTGRESVDKGREWMRRGRMSSWKESNGF
jgi:hypothetical protein